MRITIVSETYFPQVNGVSRTLSQLVRVATGAGHRVQLIHPDYGEPAAGPDDLRVRSRRVPFYPELRLPMPPYGGVARALDRFGPDLLHIATEATLGLAALRLGRRRAIPTVSSFHTNFDQYSQHYRIGWARGVIWRYLRWFHNQTRETYVPSSATIAALRGRGFERLVLWPRGVDAGLFRPDRPGRERLRRSLGFRPEEVVIAYVGRLAVEKNVEYLADALSRVHRMRPGARGLIVGDGPSRPWLEERLRGVARFVGFRSGDDLADHYAAADIFAFASTTETFGNVVLEAMASGLPSVVLASGGPAEIVRDGEDGLALPPGSDPGAFAGALVALIDDPFRRRFMAIRARGRAWERGWDEVMGALLGRYRALGSAAPTTDSSAVARAG